MFADEKPRLKAGLFVFEEYGGAVETTACARSLKSGIGFTSKGHINPHADTMSEMHLNSQDNRNLVDNSQ